MTHHETLGTPPFDRILVEVPMVEEKTKGGIFIPKSSIQNVERGIGRGHILDAGLKARDVIRGAGWRFGDEVTWGLYAPVYIEWEDAERTKHRALVLNVGDVLTNVSLAKRLNGGEQFFDVNGDGETVIRDREIPKAKNGEMHANR